MNGQVKTATPSPDILLPEFFKKVIESSGTRQTQEGHDHPEREIAIENITCRNNQEEQSERDQEKHRKY